MNNKKLIILIGLFFLLLTPRLVFGVALEEGATAVRPEAVAQPRCCCIDTACSQNCQKTFDACPTLGASASTCPLDRCELPPPSAEVQVQTRLIAPTLQIPIPTIKPFTVQDVKLVGLPGNRYVEVPFIAQYVVGIYKYGLGVAFIVSIVIVMIAGFRWMTAGGNASTIGQAKEMMATTFIGLVLLFGSYVLLNTINPDLIRAGIVRVQYIEPIKFEAEDAAETAEEGSGSVPCDNPKQNGLAKIPPMPGVRYVGRTERDYLIPAAIEPLRKAGAFAAAEGYTIVITSGCRDLAVQQNLATSDPAGVAGGTTARPGRSPHGFGYAIDTFIEKGGTKLTYNLIGHGSDGGQCRHPEEMKAFAKLATFFIKAGWKRLMNETWHFEYGRDSRPLRGTCTGYATKCNKTGADDCKT